MKISKMKDSAKAILVLLGFLLAVLLLGKLITFRFDADRAMRGEYDVAFVGSSFMSNAINEQQDDALMGERCIRLTTPGCDMAGRYAVVESVISTCHVSTIFLDVPLTALVGESDQKDFVDPAVYVSRELAGPGRKLKFLFEELSFWEDQYDYYFRTEWDYGLNSWKNYFAGEKNRYWDMDKECKTHDQTLSEEEALKTHNATKLNLSYLPENQEYLQKIVDCCKEQNVELVFTIMPISERKLWQNEGWGTYYEDISRYAKEQGIQLFDFNLLKDRQKYLTDDGSWVIEDHLSQNGQDSFCPVLLGVLRSRHETDLAQDFYASYEEAMQQSIYCQD